jgi:hypothetical protein
MVLQDFARNFLTAQFDESNGLWVYKLGKMFQFYLRGWFAVDLVRPL